jgi:hypothetical protein
MPIATYRPNNVSEIRSETTDDSLNTPKLNTTAVMAAAETNHFSCWRSSPAERR